MKYPITVTADGYALRRPAAAALLTLSDVWRFALRHWGLLAVLAITVIVHAPTLRYYFDGDDFVVLGSAEYLGGRAYIIDSFLMRDIVPNWRPLTAAVYAVEWELFGLNAFAWRSVNLGVHLSSLVIMYALVTRVSKRPAVGAMAALVFGISGAHFDTVNYVTALPHLLAMFFMLSSLLAMVVYAQGGERDKRLFGASFALFALAWLANEGSFVFAPVFVAAYALFAQRWRRAPMRLVLHAIPFVALAAGWSVYYQAFPNEQLKFDGYEWGDHVFSNYAVYLSFVLFPAHHIPLEPDTMRWVLAVAFAVALIAVAIVGPNIARVGALGIAVAIMPYAPVSIWTASRYTYAAVAFFAPVAALGAYWAYERVRTSHHLLRIPATIAGLALLATIAALYGWQTHAQEQRSGRYTERWELLVNELRANHDEVPAGTTIWIVDGPWTNPMEQYTWVPSVARAVYGDAAAFNLPAASYVNEPPADLDNAIFLQWVDGVGLRPVPAEQVVRPGDPFGVAP